MSNGPQDKSNGKPAGDPRNREKDRADTDRLDEEISSFYDDLANEPMPDRLKDLLKNLGEKDEKK